MRAPAVVASCLAALVLALVPHTAPAADALELKVKAAFVFNFVRFTTWPPERVPASGAPLDLCVLGDAAFLDALRETVAGKSLGGYALRTRGVGTADELRGCHVAYVGAGADAERALAAVSGSSVLSVHDGGMPSRHGVVRFLIEERRVRFEVNAAAAARENLQLSSKLLSLASVVSL